MSTPDDEYQAALAEFRRASDAFHDGGLPSTGPLADAYNAAAAGLKEAANHRCETDEPTRFDAR
ncbi:hypothetical protein [Nocardia sp. NPDC057440]|uniref:hypothetical protein n=1 Tax=Nocardia sp. NPDC057440 TaxID=3346134 RepID=UPI00366CB5F5